MVGLCSNWVSEDEAIVHEGRLSQCVVIPILKGKLHVCSISFTSDILHLKDSLATLERYAGWQLDKTEASLSSLRQYRQEKRLPLPFLKVEFMEVIYGFVGELLFLFRAVNSCTQGKLTESLLC